ncbi:MAG TPA: DNA gyrase subunit A, partial [Syntrophus sp. (in: bacteria)]|nr:DNA gyrase subunit A [Syntrophus sp. (in: bacteria)]
VTGICQVTGDEDLMLISDAGKIIRVRVEEVSLIHRSTQGVRLIDLDENERLVGIARVEREEEIEEILENGVEETDGSPQEIDLFDKEP